MHSLFVDHAEFLAARLVRARLTSGGLADTLGAQGYAALQRRDAAGVAYHCRGEDEAQVVVRAFILHEPQSRAWFEEFLGAARVEDLLACGALVPDAAEGLLRVAFDARPHRFGSSDTVVFSDDDGSMRRVETADPERVLGIGSASLSLLATTPVSPVGRVLDLGCGCGVQALAQAQCADTVIATDVTERAVRFSEASARAAGVGGVVECRQGSWFDPVAGETFDRIVANPPFVVGMPEVGHVYRESGLHLDGATELVVRGCPDHLAEDGMAHLLGAWVHTPDQSWQQRVSQWIPSHGVYALFLQRDVVDPTVYVDTWLRDEGLDPRDPATQAKAGAWLDHFAANDVAAIGFGFIALCRVDDSWPSVVRCEEFTQDYQAPLGEEIEQFFDRQVWLSQQDEQSLLAASYAVNPALAIEDVQVVDAEAGMGFAPAALRAVRMDGPRFSHDIDAGVRSIIAGLHPMGLSLGDVVSMWCAATGRAEMEDEIIADIVSVVRDMVDHGLLLPAEILDSMD